MAKIFGVNTKISGKVGQLLYRQTRTGTVVSELPVKPVIPRRSARQMDRRAQWANLGAIYKQFDAMLRKGYENLPPQMSVYNAFIQANIDVVKVYITKTIRLNGGAILAPYQITRGSLPSIGMAKNASNILGSSVALGSRGRLYILDEPSTGLHAKNIELLLTLLRRLVSEGNTVVIVEHRLELIAQADWIIDLGPDGGTSGGEVVFQGTPQEIIHCDRSKTGLYLKNEL